MCDLPPTRGSEYFGDLWHLTEHLVHIRHEFCSSAGAVTCGVVLAPSWWSSTKCRAIWRTVRASSRRQIIRRPRRERGGGLLSTLPVFVYVGAMHRALPQDCCQRRSVISYCISGVLSVRPGVSAAPKMTSLYSGSSRPFGGSQLPYPFEVSSFSPSSFPRFRV